MVLASPPVAWAAVARVSLPGAYPRQSPLLVVVKDPAATEANRALDAALSDVRVAIGARAFSTLSISPADAAKDPALKGSTAPSVLAMSPDLRVRAAVGAGSLSGERVWEAMRALAAEHYEGDFPAVVEATRAALAEVASAERERAALQSAGTDGVADRHARLAALDDRIHDARRRESALWPLRRRTS